METPHQPAEAHELVVIVDTYDDGTARTVLALLACGHYTEPMSAASSSFDFPDDPHHCLDCEGPRQLDIDLQARLNSTEAE